MIIPGLGHFPITCKMSEDGLYEDILLHGRPTNIYATRPSVDEDVWDIYSKDQVPGKPILRSVPGWGTIGGITVLLRGLGILLDE